MIECVSWTTGHLFDDPGLITKQFNLRCREVINRENWQNVILHDDQVEFDAYDTPATEYLIYRDKDSNVLGTVRLNPTTIPYMLRDHFSFLASQRLPEDPGVLEASRMVVDRDILNTHEKRRLVVTELVVACMERGLERQAKGMVGFMYPGFWRSTYAGAGWDLEWLGPETKLPHSEEIVRAAYMPVSQEIYQKIQQVTGIEQSILRGPRPERRVDTTRTCAGLYARHRAETKNRQDNNDNNTMRNEYA